MMIRLDREGNLRGVEPVAEPEVPEEHPAARVMASAAWLVLAMLLGAGIWLLIGISAVPFLPQAIK